ncbi:MAG: glycosyltransferase family 1 protein [Elusimicrobia bacterium]|nr:glycosyltransferase family 1 protein [Elusimicrobiota bacterium]
MRILIVSDSWHPQVNAVVRTFEALSSELAWLGHDVLVAGPEISHSLPCPGEPSIRLAVRPGRALRMLLNSFKPDTLHIATEGPLGWAARRLCIEEGRPFTTSYHTRFPEYVLARLGLPLMASRTFLKRFHAPSAAVLAATPTLKAELEAAGYERVVLWGRGVDAGQFFPRRLRLPDDPRPISLYAGRVTAEKGVEDFLRLDLPGAKWVAGDGPDLPRLEARHPDVRFWATQRPQDLARLYSAADVFVFPSRTDTYGLVLLEALACGLPVAAYPVPGPIDVVTDPKVGVLDEDLGRAARAALGLSRAACRKFALKHTWRASAERFLKIIRQSEVPTPA